MKQIITAAIAILFATHMNAQHLPDLPVKMYEITAVNVSSGFTTNVTGKELNAFQVPASANSVKMSIQVPVKDYKKYSLESQLHLMVTNIETEQVILSSYWSKLYKDTVLKSECYFPAGEYKISLVDNNAPSTVFAKRVILVKPNGTKGNLTINGYSYDVSKFKIWTCQSVDEVNWKPIGQTAKLKTGGCITFFFESLEKIKNPGTMRWKLYKVEAGGKETFINQREQNTVLEQWRRMYYEECDEFRTPGTYRIYFAVKNDSDEYYGVRDKDYFAKADVVVE